MPDHRYKHFTRVTPISVCLLLVYQTNYYNGTKERLSLKLLFSWSLVFIYAQREQKCLFIHVAFCSCYSKSAAYKYPRFLKQKEHKHTH